MVIRTGSAEPKLADRAHRQHLLRKPGQAAQRVDGLHLAMDALRKRPEALIEQMEKNLLKGTGARRQTLLPSEPEALFPALCFLPLRPGHPHRSCPPTVLRAENFILLSLG